MTAVPTLPSTFVVGKARASDLESVRLVSAFLLARPIFRGRATAAQSIATATWTSVALGTEDVDNVNGHDTVTNNSRYTAVYPGWYAVSGGVLFATNATGRRMIRFTVNGTAVDASGVFFGATASANPVVGAATELVYLNVGDYVELQAYQESGAALNVSTGGSGETNSRMSVMWQSN